MTQPTPLRRALLHAYSAGYERLARPLLFRSTAGEAHERMLRLLVRLDNRAGTALMGAVRRATTTTQPVQVGGVPLPSPLMLAAGFVKGVGFASEAQASAYPGDLIPGWRAIPALVGAVEFGSFTRWPRIGNPGVVMWRDVATQSTQNRVGLRNPGVRAAAAFLGARRAHLPDVWGVNLAPSPGVDDDDILHTELLEAVDLLLEAGLTPRWLTLNLSCPNTEDDPGARQTARQAETLTAALVQRLESTGIPLWVKLGPALAEDQYHVLLNVCAQTGVRAIVATNTLGRPTPDDARVTAGMGGGSIHPHALAAVRLLAEERARTNAPVDLVGCGGVLDGASLGDFLDAGASAVQYWSALVYRGPLAAPVIAAEARASAGAK
jgi:dihydroorotate dehydrogenase